MTLYQKKERHNFKWVIAVLVFILAMTFTVAEVGGVNVPPPNYENTVADPGPAEAMMRPDCRMESDGVSKASIRFRSDLSAQSRIPTP